MSLYYNNYVVNSTPITILAHETDEEKTELSLALESPSVSDMHVSGDGLRWGHVDQPASFIVHAKRIGELAIKVAGIYVHIIWIP